MKGKQYLSIPVRLENCILYSPAVSLPPSQPDVTEYNERSMTLQWKAPIDDGGMPITAYNVEAKTTG